MQNRDARERETGREGGRETRRRRWCTNRSTRPAPALCTRFQSRVGLQCPTVDAELDHVLHLAPGLLRVQNVVDASRHVPMRNSILVLDCQLYRGVLEASHLLAETVGARKRHIINGQECVASPGAKGGVIHLLAPKRTAKYRVGLTCVKNMCTCTHSPKSKLVLVCN